MNTSRLRFRVGGMDNTVHRKNTLGSSSGWEHRQQQMSVLAGVLFVCGKVLDDSVLPDIGARVAAALEDDRVWQKGMELTLIICVAL